MKGGKEGEQSTSQAIKPLHISRDILTIMHMRSFSHYAYSGELQYVWFLRSILKKIFLCFVLDFLGGLF